MPDKAANQPPVTPRVGADSAAESLENPPVWVAGGNPPPSLRSPHFADEWTLPRGVIVVMGLAGAIIILFGIRAFSGVVAPLFLAIVVVIAAYPLQGMMERRGLPGWAALLASLVVIYGGLLGFVLLLVVSLAQLATLMPEYTVKFNDLQGNIGDLLLEYGVSEEQVQELLSGFDYGRIVSFVTGIVSSLAGVLSSLVVIICLLFFVILDAHGFGKRLGGMFAERPDIATSLGNFARGTRTYLVVATVFGFIVAVIDVAVLYWLAIPLPILWGLLAFVTNYIPNVGFLIGVIPPMFLALLEYGWETALIVFVAYCLINFTIQSIIQPKFVGDSVGIATTVSFVSMLLWTAVLGPLGAVLAIPLTLLVKCTLLDADSTAGWTTYLVGSSSAANTRAERVESDS